MFFERVVLMFLIIVRRLDVLLDKYWVNVEQSVSAYIKKHKK